MAESKDNSELARLVSLHLGDRGNVQEAVKLGTTSKQVLQPHEIKKLREKYYSLPPEELSIETLRRLCDELYLSMTPEELKKRRPFLNEYRDFPIEINDEDGTWLSKSFHLSFERGGESCKPTNMFDYTVKILTMHPYMIVDRQTVQEWARNNERRYFENIFKALRRPIGGGKKRKTKRTNKKNKRRTIR